MQILHFSDVHVQVDYRQIGYANLDWRRLLAQLEMDGLGRARDYVQAPRIIDEIGGAARRTGADHLVLSGDLTGLAYDAEFALARAALEPIARPELLTVVAGNHDRFTPESERDETFEKHFGDLLQSDLPEYCAEGPYPFVRLLKDEAAVVGLNSARANLFPGLAHGRVGPRQLDALAALLDDPRLQGRMVFVAVHHTPLRPYGWFDVPGHGMVDADKLLRIVRGPRRAVLSGHIHQRYWLQATSDRPHIFCAGSSTCSGEEGYWLIDVEDGLVRGAEMTEMGPGLLPPPAIVPVGAAA
jgi:3',5'-cyclic AMP phosphodiesterase CpdA